MIMRVVSLLTIEEYLGKTQIFNKHLNHNLFAAFRIKKCTKIKQ